MYNTIVKNQQEGITTLFLLFIIIFAITATFFGYKYVKNKSLVNNDVAAPSHNVEEREEDDKDNSSTLLYYENSNPKLSFKYPSSFGSVTNEDTSYWAMEGKAWQLTFDGLTGAFLYPYTSLIATSGDFAPGYWEGEQHWVNKEFDMNNLQELEQHLEDTYLYPPLSFNKIENNQGVSGAHIFFLNCSHGGCEVTSMILVPLEDSDYNNLSIIHYPKGDYTYSYPVDIDEEIEKINLDDLDISEQLIIFNSLSLE